MTDREFIISELRSLSDPTYLSKMLRFGIDNRSAMGVSVPKIRLLAKEVGRNHQLSLELWDTQIHEARILACFIGDHRAVTSNQIDVWTKDFNSWDICDQACGNLFVKTPFWLEKVAQFSGEEPEFVKRCGFVLIAEAAVHLKNEPDKTFIDLLPTIVREAADQRNFVKKAINWALRQIGKRNIHLHQRAMETAQIILARENKKANWVAVDALRELRSERVYGKLNKKN